MIVTTEVQTMSNKQQYFDNTMLSSYKTCPRSYFIRHVLNWRGEGLSNPLAFGLAWHAAMDVVWEHAKDISRTELPRYALAKFQETWEEQGFPTEPTLDEAERLGARTPSTAHEMLIHYVDQRWSVLQSMDLIAGEQPFAVPLPGLPNVLYIGRLDKVVDHEGAKMVLEHKTTSEYKKDGGFKSLYVESWYNDSQVKGYQYGGSLFFPGLSQVWVDAALVHKSVHDKFRFIPVSHQQPLLLEWVEDTCEWVRRVQKDTYAYQFEDRITNGVFPRNEGQCVGKYGPCPFLDICRTVKDPSTLDGPPRGYVEEKWSPFELLGLDKLITQEQYNEPKAT